MNVVIVDLPHTRDILCGRFNFDEGTSKFTCRMIEPGIVSYMNTPEKDVVLLRKETIDRCLATAINNPLTIDHVGLDEIPAEMKNGEIAAVRYNAEDGWYYVEGSVETAHAKQLIKKGYKPSCAYIEKKVVRNNTGAKYHGFHYDKEITELEFHHLAIVKKPRYESATFRLNSLVNNPTMKLFKLLKKLVTRANDAAGTPVETVKVETHEIDSGATVEIDGETVRLNTLVESYQNREADAAGDVTVAHDDEIEIPVEGKDPLKVRLNDLVEHHRKVKGKTKTETAVRRDNANETEEQKAARIERERLAQEETVRRNAAGKESFLTLQGARFRSGHAVEGGYSTSSGSLKEKVELGKKRY